LPIVQGISKLVFVSGVVVNIGLGSMIFSPV